MTPQQKEAARRRRATWANRRRRLVAYGRWTPIEQLDPAPATQHLTMLRDTYDLSIEALAEISGEPTSVIAALLYPNHQDARKWITRPTHAALMAASYDLGLISPGRTVAARGSRRRLQALAVDGHSLSSLARVLDKHVQVLSRLNSAPHVQVGLARQIHQLYVDLEGTPGGSAYTRTHATKNGWLSRDWWDEDTIDLPHGFEEDPGDIDDVAVARALAGSGAVALRPAEAEVVIAQGLDLGLTHDEIATAAGVSSRTVLRRAKDIKQAAARVA